jgi:hypothetical protein
MKGLREKCKAEPHPFHQKMLNLLTGQSGLFRNRFKTQSPVPVSLSIRASSAKDGIDESHQADFLS